MDTLHLFYTYNIPINTQPVCNLSFIVRTTRCDCSILRDVQCIVFVAPIAPLSVVAFLYDEYITIVNAFLDVHNQGKLYKYATCEATRYNGR